MTKTTRASIYSNKHKQQKTNKQTSNQTDQHTQTSFKQKKISDSCLEAKQASQANPGSSKRHPMQSKTKQNLVTKLME